LVLLDPDPDPLVSGTDPDPSIIKQNRQIRKFLALLDPDPDPLVSGTDLDPSIIKQNQKENPLFLGTF
jgi:hypothetical protein